MKKVTCICSYILTIFSTAIFSQVQFNPPIPLENSTEIYSNAYPADLDGDGDVDIMALVDDFKIVWYENKNGNGDFDIPKTIASQLEGDMFANTPQQLLKAVDMDGDGDLDVLASSPGADKISWFMNMDGRGSFGSQRIITTALDGAGGINAADIDSDGDTDVLSASFFDDKIAWYENIDGAGTFGAQKIISTLGEQMVCVGIFDFDNDVDILSVARHSNNLVWYENTDSKGTFARKQIISNTYHNSSSYDLADVDGDGDIDIVASSRYDNTIAWHENSDGKGHFGTQNIISESIEYNPGVEIVSCVHFSDVDNDGDMDVLTAWEDPGKIILYENTDGQGSFATAHVLFSSPGRMHSIYAIDLDNDGDQDLITSSKDHIDWYENVLNPTLVQKKYPKLPHYFHIYQNYPNPFNPSTTIRFSLNKSEHISLKIYNIASQEVTELVNGVRSAGEHQVQWEADGLPSGIYLARLQAGEQIETMKLVLQK